MYGSELAFGNFSLQEVLIPVVGGMMYLCTATYVLFSYIL